MEGYYLVEFLVLAIFIVLFYLFDNFRVKPWVRGVAYATAYVLFLDIVTKW